MSAKRLQGFWPLVGLCLLLMASAIPAGAGEPASGTEMAVLQRQSEDAGNNSSESAEAITTREYADAAGTASETARVVALGETANPAARGEAAAAEARREASSRLTCSLARVEPSAPVFNPEALPPLAEQAQREAARAAREAEALASAAAIEAGAPAAPAAHPQEGCAGFASGPTAEFGWDTLVMDYPILEGHPDLVSTASGRYYVVAESMTDTYVYVYRSTNGGLSWSLYFWVFDPAGREILDPALAVPEYTEDYLYLIYEFDDEIQVLKKDLATGATTYHTVASNVFGVHRPRIATDNHDFGAYYLYVTHISGTLLGAGPGAAPQDAYEVDVVRSTDKAASWTNQTILYIPDFADPLPRPDIAYGNDGNVYVVWDEEVLGPSTEMNVHLSRSTDYGVAWEADLDLTSSTSSSCFDPRVAAIQDGDSVAVAYTKDYTTDVDVWYGYSTDAGGAWSTNHCLECVVDTDEERPDLAVDESGGDFHAAWWREFDIRYAHASSASPGSWSAKETINETNDASRTYHPPAVAVDFPTGEAGVAWSDFRDLADYAIYFDRVDWGPTVGCDYTCVPSVGTVPFVTTMTVTLINHYQGQLRRIAGRIDLTTAAGSFFSNWRSGYTNVAAGGSYVTAWNQAIPALGALIGTNVFRLAAQDVTPSPFNQPPYPPAGDTCMDACTVTASTP